MDAEISLLMANQALVPIVISPFACTFLTTLARHLRAN